MRKNSIVTLCICSIFVLMTVLSGCTTEVNSEANTNEQEKFTVYTSFYVMYDFAEKIGGDKVNIVNMVPSGTEPHDWEPSPSDIAKLENGDMFIYNGAGMESWADKILDSLSNDELILVETSEALTLLEGHHHEEEQGKDHHEDEHDDQEFDPHVWLDPLNAIKQMETIKNALVNANPENADYYKENYEYFRVELQKLDNDYKETVATFNKKDIIVSHEAYGYLCKAYGLNQIPIEGLNAESDPSPARMVEIIEFAKENDVEVIFFERLVSPKVAETIANEVGVETMVLNPIGGLMEEEIQAGKDYISVMRENLHSLKLVLQ